MNFENLQQNEIDRLADEELADSFEHEELIEKQFEKPKKLYHASVDRNIEKLNPFVARENDEAKVFAARDAGFATMFMTPYNPENTLRGQFENVWYIVIKDENEFKKIDEGGSLYVVSANGFEKTGDRKNKMKNEVFASTNSAAIEENREYNSSVDAMIDNGVQVYFVDKETFMQIIKSDDHGLDILQNIQSENQRQSINVKE